MALSKKTTRTLKTHIRALTVEGSVPIGDSGLYMGGSIQQAAELVLQGKASNEDFKFFYNQCEWLPGSLERECIQVEGALW